MTKTADAVILLCVVLIINQVLCSRHPERFTGMLLIEKDAPGVTVDPRGGNEMRKTAAGKRI